MVKVSVYDIVTDKIIAKLEAGVVPWRQPWAKTGPPVNWRTQRPYRGINLFLLDPGEYATFKQIKEAGGHVKHDEHGELVVFWKWLERKNPETGVMEGSPMLRYYTVFNILQAEGITSRRSTETWEHEPIAVAESMVADYPQGPRIKLGSGKAYYRPSADLVSIPPLIDYANPEEYYSVLFHELVHSTGHARRLNRPGITEPGHMGDESYSKEELVAELGAAILCAQAHLDTPFDNSAAYVANWLKVLRDDKHLLVSAGGQAQKAVDHILNVAFEESAVG